MKQQSRSKAQQQTSLEANQHSSVLQRAAVNATPVNAVPPVVHDVLSSPGQSLDAGTRAFMEPRFGHDFSRVRVHTDEQAAESAQAVNALAYTAGRDIVFGARQYAPETMAGQRLLAHELVHTMQQPQGGVVGMPMSISVPIDTYEQEADAQASRVMNNNSVYGPYTYKQLSTPRLQRQAEEKSGKRSSREVQTSGGLITPGYEEEISVAKYEQNLKYVKLSAEVKAKLKGSLEAEGEEASSEVTVSKKGVELEAELKTWKTKYGDIKLSGAGAVGEESGVGVKLHLGEFVEFHLQFGSEPLSTELLIDRKEGKINLGKGQGVLNGHIDLVLALGLSPSREGAAALGKSTISAGRSVITLLRGAFVTEEVGTASALGVAAPAVIAGAIYIAWVGFGLYQIGKALYEGRKEAIAEIFSSGYADMISWATEPNIGGQDFVKASDKLLAVNWQNEFAEASKLYQQPGDGPVQMQSIGLLEEAGRAAAWHDFYAYIREYGYTSWKLFSQQQQESVSKDRIARMRHYREGLHEQIVKKQTTLRVPFSVSSHVPEQKETMQRAPASADVPTKAPFIVYAVLNSPGQSLDAPTRSFMESRFGHDFSQVRIHTDQEAAESAQKLNARAYTVGTNVVFGPGQYAPDTSSGKQLLAHELAHVLQQRSHMPTWDSISSPGDASEHEADEAANAIVGGQQVNVTATTVPHAPQRQENEEDIRRTASARQETRRKLSLFPPGTEPHLQLDVMTLRNLLNLRGVSTIRPAGPPKWLPAPAPVSAGEQGQEGPQNLVTLSFDISTDPTSPEGQALVRAGLPLQSGAERAQERADRLQAVLSGKAVSDTPLGLQFLSTGINLLANTAVGKNIVKKARLSNVTFVLDPSSGTYGANVEFEIPIGKRSP